MKKLIALMGLLLAGISAHAQQPVVNCVTNIIVTITDTNAWLTGGMGGTNQISGPGGMTVTINYTNCGPASTTPIGYFTFQCDTSINCGGTEGQPTPCGPGGTHPIYMEKGCFMKQAQFFSRWGCCSIVESDSNPAVCSDPNPPPCI